MSRVVDFVHAGQRAQLVVDALGIHAAVRAVREHLDAARAWNASNPVRSKHVQRELEAALNELETLSIAIAAHFERSGGNV